MLRAFEYCAMVLTKLLNFLIQVRTEYSLQPNCCTIANLKQGGTLKFKRLSEEGGQANFSKKPPRHYL